ncbi:MAG: PDZ domain-containing protein [bacterium]
MKKHLIFLLIVTVLVSLVVGTAFTMSKSDKGWLGITTQSVNKDLSEAFDLGVDYGALINEVFEDSPAEKAKLFEEDVIVSFNGEKVSDVDDLLDLLDETKAGDEVELVIFRDGEKKNIKVTVDEHPQTSYKYALKNNLKKNIKNGYFYGSNDEDEDGDRRVFNFGDKTRGYLGVNLVDLSDQLGEYFGVSEDEGVLISSVEKDSPAEKAGIKAGDVVITADNEKIEDSGDLSKIVRDHKKGDNITLVVLRNGHRQEINCELDETNSYSWFQNPGDVDIYIPKAPHSPKVGYFNKSDFNFDDSDFEFDEGEFEQSMKEFQEAMQELGQLKDLKFEIKKESQKEYQNEMKELKKELKELQKELQEIHKKLD